MTKTLTEQWKDGELQFGKTYWCSDDEGNVAKLVLVSNNRFFEWTLGTEVTKDVKEVLAPVPSYDHFHQLVKKVECLQNKLEIATKALEQYANCKPTEWMSCVTADEALKEMEGVK